MLRKTQKVVFAFVLTATALLLSGAVVFDGDVERPADQIAVGTIVDPMGVA